MEPENVEESEIAEEPAPPSPICIGCMEPVDPAHYYCPNCGEASGQLTQYIPFVNIRWSAQVYGKMWRQMRSRNTSFAGRLFRLALIILYTPYLLIGLFFKEYKKA